MVEDEAPTFSGRGCGEERRPLRVGCALLPKKVQRYLTPAMLSVARGRGVELEVIDHTRPLIEQGHYDAIVHKLRHNKDWERNLQDYVRRVPGCKVIDSLAGIRLLGNRATMLLPLRESPQGITLQQPKGRNGCRMTARVQSPPQVEIGEGTSLAEAQALLACAGLVPPLLVKPLWTDGREGSHGLAVLHDMAALGRVLQGGLSHELQPPLVVQQFVEHGGVLYKVYVLGGRTVVCRRPSLGEPHLGSEARRAGVLSLPRISCKSTYSADSPEYRFSCGIIHDNTGTHSNRNSIDAVAPPPAPNPTAPSLSPRRPSSSPALSPAPFHPHTPPAAAPASATAAAAGGGGSCPPAAPAAEHVPPAWVTRQLAGRLRSRLGLQLFNFDMICPEQQPSPQEQELQERDQQPYERLYYVVDINYFPGVDKIPDFERIFVDFLTAACAGDGEGEGPGEGHGQGHGPGGGAEGGEAHVRPGAAGRGEARHDCGAEAAQGREATAAVVVAAGGPEGAAV